jgi:hypothetical protein
VYGITLELDGRANNSYGYVLIEKTGWMNDSRATTYGQGMRPVTLEDGVIIQFNKHSSCICAHTMAAVPLQHHHTHSSNGVLFLVNSRGVWITCLKDSCTVSLNKNWITYRTRARCVKNRIGEASLFFSASV